VSENGWGKRQFVALRFCRRRRKTRHSKICLEHCTLTWLGVGYRRGGSQNGNSGYTSTWVVLSFNMTRRRNEEVRDDRNKMEGQNRNLISNPVDSMCAIEARRLQVVGLHAA